MCIYSTVLEVRHDCQLNRCHLVKKKNDSAELPSAVNVPTPTSEPPTAQTSAQTCAKIVKQHSLLQGQKTYNPTFIHDFIIYEEAGAPRGVGGFKVCSAALRPRRKTGTGVESVESWRETLSAFHEKLDQTSLNVAKASRRTAF